LPRAEKLNANKKRERDGEIKGEEKMNARENPEIFREFFHRVNTRARHFIALSRINSFRILRISEMFRNV